jgi:AAA domain/Helix-turn-helix domain of resolvase
MIGATDDFSQRLRQMGPIYSLEELGAAAYQAGQLIHAGEVSPAKAADALWDIATARGLPQRYGVDTVQGVISCGIRDGLGATGHEAHGTNGDTPKDQPDRETEDAMDARANAQSSTLPRVSAIDLEGFLKMKIPPRSMMLTPWLPVQGLAMIYAPRGTGKTRMAHGIAHAIATGSGFLRWTAPQARRVLLLDGEMPAAVLQEMLRATVRASQRSLSDPNFFKIAAADLVRDGLPDLANPSSQQFYSDVIAEADLILVDNLSTLCRSLKENDADSWTPVQLWGLGLRRAGKSALFIHHAGKGGAQRGTSRKEDTLDAVIGLRRPPDYLPQQGARFEVHFEKSRGFYGPDAEPFEARLVGEQWAINPVKSGDDLDTLKALRKQGMSIRDIADRTGLSKSTVQRRLGLGDDEEE